VTALREAGDDDLELVVALRERIDPLTATTADDQRVFVAQSETPLVLLAGDVAFGVVWRFPPERDASLDVGVVPEARRRGVGSALYDTLLEHARSQRWESLLASAVDDEGRAWLERREFEVVDRQERVVLELAGARDTVAQAPGDVAITDFAARPDLAPEIVRLVAEGMEDVPGDLAREEPPNLETWLQWQEAPSRRPEFVVIGLDGGDVVGWAQLNVYPRVGYHAFTVVARAHRGRGIARTLKTELIRRARARGLERLITNSNVDNVPMRTLNAELGYRPAPARLYLRRSL
jgi:ribosomal protein S18 acetylase RimI-like enzyme